MKKLFYAFALLLLISCNKGNDVPDFIEDEEKTILRITVKSLFGNVVTSANVKLYLSEIEMRNGLLPFAERNTNENGIVEFNKLQPQNFWFFIEKDCINNFNGKVDFGSAVKVAKVNDVEVVLTPTGNIKMVSTSNNPYKIFLNGKEQFIMAGNSVRRINYLPLGDCTIRVLQQSGYILFPTDKTYTKYINCGDTEIIFP